MHVRTALLCQLILRPFVKQCVQFSRWGQVFCHFVCIEGSWWLGGGAIMFSYIGCLSVGQI